MKKKPLSKRAKLRLARMRREPIGRLYLEIGRYLETVGWRAVVMGGAQVRGFSDTGFGKFEFVVQFSGGRMQSAPSGASQPEQDRS